MAIFYYLHYRQLRFKGIQRDKFNVQNVLMVKEAFWDFKIRLVKNYLISWSVYWRKNKLSIGKEHLVTSLQCRSVQKQAETKELCTASNLCSMIYETVIKVTKNNVCKSCVKNFWAANAAVIIAEWMFHYESGCNSSHKLEKASWLLTYNPNKTTRTGFYPPLSQVNNSVTSPR